MTNPIGWCSQTINPITGCFNGCEYCYAQRFAERMAGRFGYATYTYGDPFAPTFHPDKLEQIKKLSRRKGQRIFLDSMGDWFSKGVKPEWIHEVLSTVEALPSPAQGEHHFLVLTKRPERILEMIHCITLPENLWWGVTVTKHEDLWRISALKDALPAAHKFVSFEPLHGSIELEQEELELQGIEWAIIGAESGRRVGRIEPEFSWIDHLAASMLQANIPLFVKDNAFRYCPPLEWHRESCQQFPEGLQ